MQIRSRAADFNLLITGISTRVELDTKKQLSSRLIFMEEENYVLEEDLLLTKEVQSCKTFNVYLIVSIFVCVLLLNLS